MNQHVSEVVIKWAQRYVSQLFQFPQYNGGINACEIEYYNTSFLVSYWASSPPHPAQKQALKKIYI